jgi:hypothetical protein
LLEELLVQTNNMPAGGTGYRDRDTGNQRSDTIDPLPPGSRKTAPLAAALAISGRKGGGGGEQQ